MNVMVSSPTSCCYFSGSRKVTSAKDKELKRLNEKIVNLEVLLEQVKKENEGYKSDINKLTEQVSYKWIFMFTCLCLHASVELVAVIYGCDIRIILYITLAN